MFNVGKRVQIQYVWFQGLFFMHLRSKVTNKKFDPHVNIKGLHNCQIFKPHFTETLKYLHFKPITSQGSEYLVLTQSFQLSVSLWFAFKMSNAPRCLLLKVTDLLDACNLLSYTMSIVRKIIYMYFSTPIMSHK